MAEIEVSTLTVSKERISIYHPLRRGDHLTHERGANECENTSNKVPWHVVSEFRHQSAVEEREEYDHDDER